MYGSMDLFSALIGKESAVQINIIISGKEEQLNFFNILFCYVLDFRFGFLHQVPLGFKRNFKTYCCMWFFTESMSFIINL